MITPNGNGWSTGQTVGKRRGKVSQKKQSHPWGRKFRRAMAKLKPKPGQMPVYNHTDKRWELVGKVKDDK